MDEEDFEWVETITLEVGASIKDLDEALKSAEDNAWEHAKESALVLDIELGDDEFVTIFQELNKRYTHNVDHLQFFMTTALLLVKSMLETELITIFVDDEKLREEVAHRIGIIANCIVNSYMWIAGGYELTWLSNDELPEDVKIKFDFNPENVLLTEEEE